MTSSVGEWFLGSRALRLLAFHALNGWQYVAGSNVRLCELGMAAWRHLVEEVPIRNHLLLCDGGARSALSLPDASRALVTTVAEAGLHHFEEVLRTAHQLASAPDVEQVFEAMSRNGDPFDYRLALNPRDVADPRNEVFVKFALQPTIGGLVQQYFRMPCRLKEVRLMIDRPVPGAPRASQKWHRDPDDWMTVAVFVYLSDVDSNSAPFCYIPLNQCRTMYDRVGKFRELPKWDTTPDARMEKMVPRAHWVEVTGPTGTVVFVDTASCFHRGKQAVSSRRLCLQLVFTSTFARMDLMEAQSQRLLRPESERRYVSESPAYMVASAAPRVSAERVGAQPA